MVVVVNFFIVLDVFDVYVCSGFINFIWLIIRAMEQENFDVVMVMFNGGMVCFDDFFSVGVII